VSNLYQTLLGLANSSDALLNSVSSLLVAAPDSLSTALPFAAEASWITGKWDVLQRLLANQTASNSQDFNVGIGKAFLAIRGQDPLQFQTIISSLRATISRGFSPSTTASLSNAHSHLIRLHALYEIELLSPFSKCRPYNEEVMPTLAGRLEILGSLTDDKQYILGIRRAALDLASPVLDRQVIESASASAWLTSSRLARKGNQINKAYDAVLRATVLKDGEATIEHSRLLWKDGHHRRAIQNLQGAIAKNSFASNSRSAPRDSVPDSNSLVTASHNMLIAKTQLLLAKWMDFAGQGRSDTILTNYKNAADSYRKWDKGHYYLGSYYNKVLDSEKEAPAAMQTESYLSGEIDKLVIENYLRSMVYGPKYLYRTVPKVLTLWLDFAQDVSAKVKAQNQKPHTDKRRTARQAQPEIPYIEERTKFLERINLQVDKYLLNRIPAYIPYTAFAQILSRIDNPHQRTLGLITTLIVNVTLRYPRQALWSILAVSHSKIADKKSRAAVILNAVQAWKKSKLDLRALVNGGSNLTNALLEVCKVSVDSRGYASLSRDLGFKRELNAPSGLVVPLQQTLTAQLSTTTGSVAIKDNRPFTTNPITINGFQDQVLILSSLQKPRKLNIRGSDGKEYPLLCKPKDDLRKDQRLMEFNAMIDRALKRDVEASKRKLYIKTYAVTPLNDEHGILEWVDNLKPLRDIIVALYSKQGVNVNYNEIRMLLDTACSNPDNSHTIFTTKVLSRFPPVLYKWFIETFPEPDAWYKARLQYSRSCAVTSIVGHALGLGDRHGENISLEQGSGGVFHVDFNCLFEKGMTFEKPEMVPFRLTHNMVDAFGVYGYEGPFRMAAEITQRTLKQYEDTLMTIMETFLYDPTTDFGLENRKRVAGVPETPAEVLESVKAKFNCSLRGETVPLSVEGYVDALIRMAVDPKNLVRMYVGWCAYL
jgi:serine/threonine-protein kinase ATR